ncbi:mobilization protein MobC [Acinetobacter sp. 187]|uniref:mobilization protein MobC n=1 Tax=Acinetobacter lanii TaxID=2715163 RepID=UPI00140DCAC8|nr:mobilization protein MobC [Acinetobacter lanii]NHC05051.1 mobilization protein MobC [Acinetobacter lanii]
MTKDNKIFFRVNPSVLEWWEKRCEKQGVKKGEPFQKALELAYQKENDPEFSGQEFALHLEDEWAEKIYVLAKAEHLNPNEWIEDLVREKIAEKEKQKERIDVFEKTVRKELRIKPSLLQKIEERASLSKMKTNQYIISVLSANVVKDVQFFSHDQILKLGESNSRLMAMGRNLNQMVKVMNQGNLGAYDRDFVGRVHELLKAHVRHVFLLLEQNKKRWE